MPIYLKNKNRFPMILLFMCNGTKITYSKRKTGFIGIIIGIKNALKYYQILMEEGNMSHLLTYKLSQDYLETFLVQFEVGEVSTTIQLASSFKQYISNY